MIGDGACLFHSISYHVFSTPDYHFEIVRKGIVDYVAHWGELQHHTNDRDGDIFETVDAYSCEMSKNNTYGSFCEIFAAAQIYSFKFVIISCNTLTKKKQATGM